VLKVVSSKRADGSQLAVEFVTLGDRQGHTIFFVSADGVRTALLESVEGTSADDWPPSPPLQNLTVEERADGRRVALLVGMAGSGHWSASIESAAGEGRIVFDIACRHTEQPRWLGSRYRVMSTDRLPLIIDPGGAGMTVRDTMLVIEPTPPYTTWGTTRWRYSLGPRIGGHSLPKG
jgi:hypothetical protein